MSWEMLARGCSCAGSMRNWFTSCAVVGSKGVGWKVSRGSELTLLPDEVVVCVVEDLRPVRVSHLQVCQSEDDDSIQHQTHIVILAYADIARARESD